MIRRRERDRNSEEQIPLPRTNTLVYPFAGCRTARSFCVKCIRKPVFALVLPTCHRHVGFEWVRIHESSPTNKNPPAQLVGFYWWGKVDSNHRSYKQQIYSLSPLATREFPHMKFACLCGAGRRTRTPDLLITNQLLYQLSYTGRRSAHIRLLYYTMFSANVKTI